MLNRFSMNNLYLAFLAELKSYYLTIYSAK